MCDLPLPDPKEIVESLDQMARGSLEAAKEATDKLQDAVGLASAMQEQRNEAMSVMNAAIAQLQLMRRDIQLAGNMAFIFSRLAETPRQKQWVIDQMLRKLCGETYEATILEYEQQMQDKGFEDWQWDQGEQPGFMVDWDLFTN